MAAKLCHIAGLLLLAGVAAAAAAPAIPPSELPGRERERFTPSPLDRFTDPLAPSRSAEPLWRWCEEQPVRRKKKRAKGSQAC